MGIIDEVIAATEREVTFDVLVFKIRKVCSRDLVLHGRPMLAAIPTGNEPGAEEPAPQPDDEAARLRSLINSTLRNPMAVVDQIEMRNVVVCAGVTAARKPGGEWETVHLTPAPEDEDRERAVMWVERLDPDMLAKLFAEILSLSSSPEVARHLTTFRGGPERGGARGRTRKKVR